MKNLNDGIGYVALAAICISIVYFTHTAIPAVVLAILGFLLIQVAPIWGFFYPFVKIMNLF